MSYENRFPLLDFLVEILMKYVTLLVKDNSLVTFEL